MDKSLGSAIEKIKQQEQDKEAKLKAKREYEATKAAVVRSVREAFTQAKFFHQEQIELARKVDELGAQVTIQKIRRDALAAQLVDSRQQLERLHMKAARAVIETQELRNSYCAAVHDVSDKCDVWALLMKPVSMESIPRAVKKTDNIDQTLADYESRLKEAMERKEKASKERARLLAEPEEGEEFLRIKNALRYSLEMTTKMKNTKQDC